MDNDYPRMLYKAGGAEEIHGGKFATLVVNNEKEQDAAVADGWHLTTPDAKDAHEADKADKAKQSVPANDNDAPTRAELEQKATELGLTYAPNIGDAKLALKIAEALKAKG